MRLSRNILRPHLIALLCVALATVARYLIDPLFPGIVPFATYFPAVVAAGYFGGYGGCATAVVTSIVASWFFFLPPALSFVVPGGVHALNLFLFSVAGAVTGGVAALLRQQIRAAKRVEARLRRGQAAGGVADWEWDIDSNETFWSDSFFTLLGLASGAAPAGAATLYNAMHPDDRDRMHEAVRRAADELGHFEAEFRIIHPDGSLHWLSTRADVERGPAGSRRMSGVVIDITRLKEAERQREMMFHELNHRVKNNFQIVSSLLRLQAGRIKDPAARAHLNDAMQRVVTISDIHNALYRGGHIDTIDLGQYLVDLCRKLQQSLLQKTTIALDVQVVSAVLKVDRVIPLGLIANELITNAVKHAFPDGRNGRIEVRLLRNNDVYVLTIADDGIGLPADSRDRGGLGTRLIEGFVDQADGRMSVIREQGTRFDIVLPDDPAKH